MKHMLEQSEGKFKVFLINVLKILMKRLDNMQEKLGNFKQIKIIRKRWNHRKETVEIWMPSTARSRLDTAEEKVSELNKWRDITYNEIREEKNKQKQRKIWASHRSGTGSNNLICITEITKREEKENDAEVFEQIITEMFKSNDRHEDQ